MIACLQVSPVLLLQSSWAEVSNKLRGAFTKFYSDFFDALPGILTGALIFLVFLIVAGIGRRLIARIAPRTGADAGVVLLLSRVFYYSVLTFGVLTALSNTGLNVNALFAGLGLTGFALGFALKDVLSNLLAGIMLLVYRPFQIGDHIKMGEFEGMIVTIRMRDTVLRAADNRSIIIPNTKLITEVVVNHSTADLSRDTLLIGVAGDEAIARARQIVRRVMMEAGELVERVESQVTIGEAADKSTTLETGFWFDPRRRVRAGVREALTARLRQAFEQAGLPFVVSAGHTPAAKPGEPVEPTDELGS